MFRITTLALFPLLLMNACAAPTSREVKVPLTSPARAAEAIVTIVDLETGTLTPEVSQVSEVLRPILAGGPTAGETTTAVLMALQAAYPGAVKLANVPLYYAVKWCAETMEWKFICCDGATMDVALGSTVVRTKVEMTIQLYP